MKIGAFLVILAIMLTSSYAVVDNYGYAESNYDAVRVNTLKYEPYPAQPGRYVDLWLRIENSGQEPTTDVEFTLVPRYPFTLGEDENETRYVGTLKGKETALLHYKVRVDASAVQGNNLIDYKIRTRSRLESSSLNIFVQTIDANIAINSVSAEQLVPGIVSDVTLHLTNEADSALGAIAVVFDFSSSDIPIVPVNSTGEKKIYGILPGMTLPITFQLMALPDAASNTYKVPIEIRFVDGTGTQYNKSSIIGLTVGAKPEISITTVESGIYGTGQIGNVALKFTNKGLSDIKLLTVTLQESNNYTIISEDELYLGNIDSDDYETAEFRIKAKKAKDNIVPLIINLEYRDANNKQYHETRMAGLKITSAKDLGVQGGGSGFGTLLFAIIFIVAGFFIYKRWEKKKKSSKK